MWKITNIKTQSHGVQKRDPALMPIFSPDDPRLLYLQNLKEELERWEMSGFAGFSSATFMALKQSCSVIPALCQYLLQQSGFAFVLPGNKQHSFYFLTQGEKFSFRAFSI